jgi:hypothetical protein
MLKANSKASGQAPEFESYPGHLPKFTPGYPRATPEPPIVRSEPACRPPESGRSEGQRRVAR